MKKKIISILLSSAMIFSMGISTVSAAAADDTASTESIVVSKTEGITDTTYGKVRGFIDEGTYTFRGITYAKADRFEMPEAPDSWDGIRNCLVYGSTAPITKMTDPDGGDSSSLLGSERRLPESECLDTGSGYQCKETGYGMVPRWWIHQWFLY